MLTVPTAAAQPNYCDELLHYGDTTICQDFTGKKKRLFREHFYVKGELIFTRWWSYQKDGAYSWRQKRKKSPFAKADGPSVGYYADGTMRVINFFSNGKQVKHCQEYYPSGKIKLRCYHNDRGQKNGIRTTYYENGQVESKARWENGLLREIQEYKDEQGHDLVIGSFRQGTGDWIRYENGRPIERYFFKDGREGKRQKITPMDALNNH